MKNNNIGYKSFKLNSRYYFYILFKEDTNFYSKSKLADKQVKKLKNLIIIYYKKPLLYRKTSEAISL